VTSGYTITEAIAPQVRPLSGTSVELGVGEDDDILDLLWETLRLLTAGKWRLSPVRLHGDVSSLQGSSELTAGLDSTWASSPEFFLDEILQHVDDEKTRSFIDNEGLQLSVAWACSEVRKVLGDVSFNVELLPDDGEDLPQLAFVIHASMSRKTFKEGKRKLYESMRVDHVCLYRLASIFTDESLTCFQCSRKAALADE